MLRKIFNMILVACIPVFFVNTAAADEYHYTNLLIGDRASGMGGAYTAISDDATGLYYNPAGVFYTTGRSLSASVNAYYNTEKTYKSVIGGNGWVRKSSSLLPNYFGVVQPMGDYKIGISYAVPDSIVEDQSQTFNDLPLADQVNNPGVNISSYIINFNNESNTYNVGPSIAREFSDKLSAGLTLYYYQKKDLHILNQLLKMSNGGYEWDSNYYHSSEMGVRPILGLMLTPIKNVSVGLAVSKVMVLNSNTSVQNSQIKHGFNFYDYDNNGNVILINDKVSLPDGQWNTSARRKYPTQVSLGVAWFPTQSLLLTGDLNYYTKVHQQIVDIGGQPSILRPEAEAVTNISIGSEYYYTKNVAVRVGFYSNYANTPDVQAGGTSQNEHIDLSGGTVSISNFTRNTSVTLGGGWMFGTGKAQITGSSKIQDAVSQGWMFFLSSSYSY